MLHRNLILYTFYCLNVFIYNKRYECTKTIKTKTIVSGVKVYEKKMCSTM